VGGVVNNALRSEEFNLVRKLMERSGYKFTKQRKLILEQFFLADSHLSSEEIFQRLIKTNIGLATVYRNVGIFSKIGIVKEIVVDGISYYELKIFSKKPLHIHFRCIKCNDIIDVDEGEVALSYLELNKTIEKTNDVEIYDVNIMFVGLCKRCREAGKWQDQ
jgi:Fur family ferric uptake transcriptional regulator